MSIQLKIKAKHLALEPAVIKHEEQKLKKQIKAYREYYQVTEHGWSAISKSHKNLFDLEAKLISLASHRKWDVRNESRATALARAYLAGKSYTLIERSRKDEMLFVNRIVPRIVAMVTKYGNYDQRKVTVETIKTWSTITKN
jgi:hypothetical protein